jgi:hypothetical protein
VTDSTELLVLRLALIGSVFGFVLAAAAALRASLAPRRAPALAMAGHYARLVLETPARSGLVRGTQFELPGDTTLGRDESNGIVLADPSISGRHASIERTARGWMVRDLGSTNGTAVGADPVDGRGTLLRPGDEVRVGAVRFRFLA